MSEIDKGSGQLNSGCKAITTREQGAIPCPSIATLPGCFVARTLLSSERQANQSVADMISFPGWNGPHHECFGMACSSVGSSGGFGCLCKRLW